MTTLNFNGQKINIEATLRDLDRADCEDSLYTFLRYGWRYISAAPFVDGWPIEAVAEHLQAVVDGDIRRLIINIPPRCAKSSLTSVALPAWTWAQRTISPTSGPGVQFLHASYAQQLSLRDSVACRRLIESPWYQSMWKDRFRLVSDQNTKTRFDNDKRGSRLSTSVGSALTGEGGSCFVAGTMVSTPKGQKAIEDIRPGDVVMAFDHSRGKVVKSKVTATAKRASNDIYELCSVSGHRIVCTGDHPIFSPGRGYIHADKMGQGNGLIVESWQINTASPDLRQMREEHDKTLVRSEKGAKAREPGRLLQQEVFFNASRNKARETLYNLFKSVKASAFAILFRQMPNNWQIQKTKEKTLSRLQNGVCWLGNVLFSSMRGHFAFTKYAWDKKFQFQKDWKIFQSIHSNEKSYFGERQSRLCDMRRVKQKVWGKTSKGLFASPSYQREHAGQSTREFDYAVRELSQTTSSWNACYVESVERLGSESISVYDIQVEKHSNFFANAILVHNCIIVDDPNAAQEAFSDATITSTIEWWDNALSTRLNDPKTGAYIVIQQRLSEEDLTGHILSKDVGDWTHLCLPMRYEPERSFVTSIGWQDPRTQSGELLWPERFGEPEVKMLERQLGPWATAGQLQQRPEPKGGGIIKRDWWQLWMEDAYPPLEYIVASLDTAYTTQTENDFSAMTVWGIFSGDIVAQNVKANDGETRRSYATKAPCAMLMNGWQERLELHELVQKVAKTCKDMKIDKLIIENKAAGHSVAQEIRRLFNHEPWAVQLLDPKGQDKLARLYSVQHLFAEGMVWAPDRTWADTVITQVSTFPKGKHDDLVDTVSQSLRHLRDLGLLTRGAELTAQIEGDMQVMNYNLPPIYPV